MLTDEYRDTILVNEEEVYKCVLTDTWKTSIMVKKEDEKEALQLIENLKNNNSDICASDVTSELCMLNYIETGISDALIEPRQGEYIIIYSEDDDVNVGDDPYMWDYDQYGYTYWDGSNQKELLFDETEEVKQVGKHTIREDKINYGRAINYYIVKNDNDEFFVFQDNEGYCDPASKIESETNTYSTDNQTAIQLSLKESDESIVIFGSDSNLNIEYFDDKITENEIMKKIHNWE